MFRLTFILVALCCSLVCRSQTIREFHHLCNSVALNTKFDAAHSSLPYEYDKYSYGKTYRLNCPQITSLYNLPIEKILIHVIETDTVNAIKIYLPFDSTFHKRLEADLGPSEVAWMLFDPGHVDTTGIIWDRRWFVDDYIVWFRCTRYIPLLGETRDDAIIIALLPRTKSLQDAKAKDQKSN